MSDGYVELLVVPADSVETFCSSCGQLRLWAKGGRPSACGHCGSSAIEVEPLNGERLPALREAWRKERGLG